MFKPGDHVHHKPTGEDWLLKRVDGKYVQPAGWPPCRARADDCILIKRAEDTPYRLGNRGDEVFAVVRKKG